MTPQLQNCKLDRITKVSLFKNGPIFKQQKMILADDEPYNIEVVIGLIKILGMRDVEKLIYVSNDGTETVDLVQKAIDEGDPFRYSLIITDCSMPEMDGYDSTKAIREMLRYQEADEDQLSLKIVALTGHVEEEFIKKAYASGIDEVLSKPI